MAMTMPEKRSYPLKNPPQEKRHADADSVVQKKQNGATATTESGKGVRQGGKERVQPAEAILRCQMCGREQKVVFRVGTPPEWHKCIWCGELQPTAGYHVVAYGLGLPRVLAPHEIKAREANLGY